MPDDRPKRAVTHSDARDRRRTPGRGIPTEIDPELTPPPQMVPVPNDSTGTPPAVLDKLDALEAGLEQAYQALGKVWDSRKDADRLDKLEHRIDTSARESAELGALLREFVMPALKSSMARIDLLLTHHEGNKVRQELFYDRDWPAFAKAFESIGDRLGRLERTVHDSQNDMRGMSERFAVSHGQIASRITSVEAVGNSHDVRITALERVNEDAKTVDQALMKQERRKTVGQAGIVTTIVAGAGWLLQHFTK